MKTKIIAAVLIAASTAIAAPAFASGYGPAPAYRPGIGAPSSQRGPSAQTLAAEAQQVNDNTVAYGGVRNGNSQTGTRIVTPTDAMSSRNSKLFSHH